MLIVQISTCAISKRSKKIQVLIIKEDVTKNSKINNKKIEQEHTDLHGNPRRKKTTSR